jgi:ribonuclease J
MTHNRLIYLPLGGAGEIGMNCYVYGYGAPGAERLVVVDLGVTFPDMETTPGVDLILPDISWLAENADRIEAVFITHAHEDHVGAVGHLWGQLRVPVYARKFTAAIARRKMEEHGHDPLSVQVVEAFPAMVPCGQMEVGFMPVTHSIPEASGLVIDSPAGRVVHTGDFKLDETPVLGEPFSEAAWRAVAAPGVKALICDSTNVFSPAPGRTEASVGPEIEKLVAGATGMVVATTFASNIARVKTLAEAGRAAGRSIVLLGRAMQRMVQTAKETSILDDFPHLISADDATQIPRENLMLLVTGSQGERRAASAQLTRGKYQGLQVKDGDLFLFSSKTIPGNEIGVNRIINSFAEMGVEVVDDSSGLYHVSGHANRPDLARVHQIMNPEIMIPMHGEARHLLAHSKLAQEAGFASMVVRNGTMVDLAGHAPKVVEHVETSRVYYDGKAHIGALDGVIRDRIRMALNGVVLVSVIIDEEDSFAGDSWVEVKGLSERGRGRALLAEELEDSVNAALGRAGAKVLRNDDAIEEQVKRAVRSACNDEIGKKPEVVVLVSRLIDG